MVTSIALIDRRSKNAEEAIRSIATTCVVIVIILTGITLLTRDRLPACAPERPDTVALCLSSVQPSLHVSNVRL